MVLMLWIYLDGYVKIESINLSNFANMIQTIDLNTKAAKAVLEEW